MWLIFRTRSANDDVLMRMCNTNAQANMLARTFHMCSADVKIGLFRAYCMQHTSGGIIGTARWIRLRLHTVTPFKLYWGTDCGKVPALFVTCNVVTINTMWTNIIYKFRCRMNQSKNGIIMSLTDLSNLRYASMYWKYRLEQLHQF